MRIRVLSFLAFFLAVGWGHTADLTQATFTEVINHVTVSDAKGEKTRDAKPQTKFVVPEVLRTGANSRAELMAPDETLTRVGSNTIFSFKSEGRKLNLQKGSVLFNPPPGRGGGTIQTAAATASVLGTTIIASFHPKTGFKLLVLEGKAKVILPNGVSGTLHAGQMILIPMGATKLPPIFGFILKKEMKEALLVKGFKRKLPSLDRILAAIEDQEELLADGRLQIIQSGGNTFLIDPNSQRAFFLQQENQNRPGQTTPTPPSSPPPFNIPSGS